MELATEDVLEFNIRKNWQQCGLLFFCPLKQLPSQAETKDPEELFRRRGTLNLWVLLVLEMLMYY